MIRFFSIFLLTIILAFSENHKSIKGLWKESSGSTSGKIKSTKNTLSLTDRKQKQLNKQLSKIAQSILKAEKENRVLAKTLIRLQKSKETNEDKYMEANQKINQYKGKIASLDKTITYQNNYFMQLLIEQFSLLIAMNEIEQKSVDSVVMQEVFESYKKKTNQEIINLKLKIDKSLKKKKEVLGYQKRIEKSISNITKKREMYLKKKSDKEKLLKKLASDESLYRKNIKVLMRKQSMIRSTLAKLNIIRQDEITKEKALEEARQKEINRRASVRNKARDTDDGGHVAAQSFTNNEHVKQVGSSYHRNKIYRYRGAKTISPLKHGKVVKSFGTYIDPIYKMKIFNESITLKSSKTNAKVRNVLNGKVVFAGENSMLGKVIVIAHGNQLHTVYAGLSRISPTIKVGSRVKKNTVIGKIKHKLIFEATKNSKYINPLRLIRL